uniref:Uncharacterized protein n=1 Tax=Bactrocera latifrons TaxID=174628 RepID=A0A0K8W3Q0_BACLA
MYDLGDVTKRNPERVAFERALKESAKPSANGHLNKNVKTNGVLKKSKSANGVSNNNTLSAQNEHTVKSLDEIMNMNEVSDDLIEMRHNGKVFYIEDNRSHSSKNSLDKSDGEKDGTREDEKSVIAMLDDVLQAADTGTTITSNMPDYRKFSVDSEMLPSVIEMNTIATVHTSSNSSDDLEAVPEVESGKGSSCSSLSSGTERFTATQAVAKQLVDDILNSAELTEALTREKSLNEAVNLKISNGGTSSDEIPTNLLNSNILTDSTERKPNSTEEYDSTEFKPSRTEANESLTRKNSKSSLLSIDDPIHSENFRNRLSKILMLPPVQITPHKAPQKEQASADKTATANSSPRPQLKHSKSETDLRQLVLQAIVNTGLVEANDNAPSDSNVNGIPKPPKFDPILYKTINNLRSNKERPSLQRLMETNETLHAPTKPAEPTEEPALPFKQKLEAVLKRGPSHRLQQRPEVMPIRRPKSVEPIRVQEEAEEQLKLRPRSNGSIARSENNLATKVSVEDGANMLTNARSLLKHVPNGTVELFG